MTPEQQQEAVERILAKLDEVKKEISDFSTLIALMWGLWCLRKIFEDVVLH